MRKLIVCLLALVVGLFLGTAAYSLDKGPEVIVLKAKKGNVTFHHREHQDKLKIKCGECHHGKTADWKQVPYKEGMKIHECKECHNKEMPNKELNKVSKAMHKNCKGCHKKMHKKYPEAPVKCKQCHVKKK